jgi:hypothetical protein
VKVALIEERVDKLEEMMMRLVYIQQKTEMEIQELKKEMKEFKDEVRREMKAFKEEVRRDTKILKEEMKAFKDEMLAFKDEMKAFKDEMLSFKDEMKVFKDEMKAFKDEMKVFKDEMLAFKDEMKMFKDEMIAFKNEVKVFKDEMAKFKDTVEKEVKRINKQWGELANKMGTLVEDIVFPATRPVLKRYFNCDPEILMMNVKRKKGALREEFDIVAVCEDKVFLIEVKSTLRTEHAREMKEKMKRFRELFSEYQEKELYPILASLRIEEEVLSKLTKEKIYGMAYKEWENMEILNFKEIKDALQSN